MTRKIVALAAAGLFAASTGLAFAQNTNRTPGHEMQRKGSVKGHPGASGYAPGHEMQDKGSVKGHPGASGYAPGHK